MNDELDFDAVLLKKITDAYATKFPVLCGMGCNEIVGEVVRLIEAAPQPAVTPVYGPTCCGNPDDCPRAYTTDCIPRTQPTHTEAAPMNRDAGMRCTYCCAKAGDPHVEGCPEVPGGAK